MAGTTHTVRRVRGSALPKRMALVVVVTLTAALLVAGLAGADELDAPSEGFGAEVLAPHATFSDDVAAKFRLQYDRGRTIVSNLPRDASTVVVAKVTWAPGASSGWHTHPGPVIVSVVEGSVELTNARDCVTHTYSAGEAFLDPGQGNVHIATNVGNTDAVAYATFLGVPDGAPATEWVEPADC